MPKPPDPFHEFVAELFGALGPLTIKRTFGGAGVWKDGVMFALLADDVIYIKVDDALRAGLGAEGGAPFLWIKPSTGQEIDLGYVSLPSSAMDNPDEAAVWGRRAVSVASAKAAAKPPARRKSRPAK